MKEIIEQLNTKISNCKSEADRLNKAADRLLFMQDLFSYLAKKYEEIPTDDDLSEVADLVRRADIANGAVTISVETAVRIAAALEAAQYPPIVRAVLAFLEHVDLGKEWAAVSDDAGIYMFDVKPSFDPFFGFWLPSESICAYNLYLTISIEIAETLLFQRTANGWEWMGNPENQNTNGQEKD